MLGGMGREPLVPPTLLQRPFTVAEARQAGLRRWHLKGASWTRLTRGTYVSKRLASDPFQRLDAARNRLPSDAAFSGLTAAWLHGIDVPPCEPIEATVPKTCGVSARAGILIHRSELAGDVVQVRGMRATSIARTLSDLSARLGTSEAVVLVDAALHGRLIQLDTLGSWVASNRRRRGIACLRRAIGLAEPATESPMESRLRMLLVLAGLPRPKVQARIYDASGRFAGRLDLYYESHRLGIEYDGNLHRTALVEDNRRQNRLHSAGVTLLRFTAADVLGNPQSVIAQVRNALVPAKAQLRRPPMA